MNFALSLLSETICVIGTSPNLNSMVSHLEHIVKLTIDYITVCLVF